MGVVRRKTAAWEHVQSEDGGTCNFDTAVFKLDGARSATIKRAGELSGVDVDVRPWLGSNYVFVNVGEGQGNRRTRMAEAAAKVLKDKGLDACVYYQMD